MVSTLPTNILKKRMTATGMLLRDLLATANIPIVTEATKARITPRKLLLSFSMS